ncbi:hypothetical protein, partial [Roseicyclus sp.]|uniref:hypothetical protein n=1 Tax=Roseicyclus sp. TaxID=1914329 RepID=UPI003F6C31AC
AAGKLHARLSLFWVQKHTIDIYILPKITEVNLSHDIGSFHCGLSMLDAPRSANVQKLQIQRLGKT